MLDKAKLIAQLHKVADQLFADESGNHNHIRALWSAIIADPLFLHKVKMVDNAPWPVPLWQDTLGRIIDVPDYGKSHVVLSVDGSQIYPDRHHVSPCFLINTGSVVLPYAHQAQRVELYSAPTVFAVEDAAMPFTTDMVNCKRQELELQEGLALAKKIKDKYAHCPVTSTLLFDGSLIFWHLSSKEKEVRDLFLHSYCALLHELYSEKIVTAWYISAPKSKELVNLVRLYMCDFDPTKKEAYEMCNAVTDATIMHAFLPSFTRSIVFQNGSSITNYYPAVVRPYFFYMNVGQEIGRVEIPAWIAHDECLVNDVACVVLDQCTKGDGYPVALAEAHEQAVIKGPDRDFFYHFLQKMIIERGKRVSVSRKSLKKRGIQI